MQTIPLQRLYQVSGIIAAMLLALLLVGTATGRNTLAWIYLRPPRPLQTQHTSTRFPWTGWTRPARSACSSTANRRRLYESHTDQSA